MPRLPMIGMTLMLTIGSATAHANMSKLPTQHARPRVQEALIILSTKIVWTLPQSTPQNSSILTPIIASNRMLMRGPLMRLDPVDSLAFMDVIRSADRVRHLVRALLLVKPNAVNPDAIEDKLVEVFSRPKADFLIELLTYVSYDSNNKGRVYFPNSRTVDMEDYFQARDAIVHESCHGFMHMHGNPTTGFNEGLCIALPKYINGDKVDIAETVYGSVLYYRDVKLEGYSTNVPIGNLDRLDDKARVMVRMLMAHDASRIDWFNKHEVQCHFDRIWFRLDRKYGQKDWDGWLRSVDEAVEQGALSGCDGGPERWVLAMAPAIRVPPDFVVRPRVFNRVAMTLDGPVAESFFRLAPPIQEEILREAQRRGEEAYRDREQIDGEASTEADLWPEARRAAAEAIAWGLSERNVLSQHAEEKLKNILRTNDTDAHQ